jgi:hypothetical protein
LHSVNKNLEEPAEIEMEEEKEAKKIPLESKSYTNYFILF